jgi:predicted GIY-YIG superfamily endonuclease
VSLDSSVRGRTIRLFLTDGSPSGILTAEIMNWTGKVVVAPRSRLPDLLRRDEVSKTGIYVLAGADPDDQSRQRIYIGEGDNVRARLQQHNADESKDFFTRVLVLVSKDENLTKTHARYLESRLITLTKRAGRAKLANGTDPEFARLPESDKADMDFYIEQIEMMLPVLGFDFTQSIPASQPASAAGAAPQVEGGVQFELSTVGVRATAIEADGKFVVAAGSTARLVGTPTWTSYRQLRDKLLADGKLVETDPPNTLRFVEDLAFDSPSAAASVVVAGNQNGRLVWRVIGSGETYKVWQEARIAAPADVKEAP